MRLQRRGTATLTTDSRLCRRIFYADTYNTEGLKAPGYLFSRLPDDFAQPSPLANQKTCSSVLLSNLIAHRSPLYNIIMYRENKSSFETH